MLVGAFWKQSAFTLQFLFGAPLKQSTYTLQLLLGGPFESRTPTKVAARGPLKVEYLQP